MNRREVLLSAAGIFVVALAVRVVAASLVVFPTPEDTAYYVNVARNVVEGHGLTADAIWSFQTPPLHFPRPAFEVWLPLPSFLAAIPMAILGPTFRAAQLMPVVVGSLVPVLAWRLAADVAAERRLPAGRARTLALGAGLTAAVYLPLVLFSALPDSTALFTVVALGAAILMTGMLRDERNGEEASTGRLVALGLLIGLAALTRNEAAWIALTWLVLVWRARGFTIRRGLLLVGIPAAVAIAVFTPWAIRDWAEFGTPLPGQALVNALSVSGFDIFAWRDRPTIARYLAVGPARLLEMRAEGIGHNLFNVLLLPGIPVALAGLVALPSTGRSLTLRPVVLVTVMTFLVTSLLFPISTTWGTFLHAAGPAHVLLIISALLALDGLIARVGRARGWTRPVAWLGAALTLFGSILFSVALFPFYGHQSEAVRDRLVASDQQLAAAGISLRDGGPVITDFPIWLAEATGARGLGLPDESPADVLDLARAFPGTKTLLVSAEAHGSWPAILNRGGPGTECFEEVRLGTPADPVLARALDGSRVFRIVCP